MKFIIEIEIGALLPAELCSVKAKDRSQHENSSAWAIQATVRPCRRRTEIPERNPKQTHDSQSRTLNPDSEAMSVRPALRRDRSTPRPGRSGRSPGSSRARADYRVAPSPR